MKRLSFDGRLAQAVTLGLAALFSSLAPAARAQFTSPYVSLQGNLSTSTGVATQNATLTITPSFVPMLVAGSSVVVTAGQCATDASGSVVEIGNPLTAPRGSAQYVGALPAGNYYIKITWYDQFGSEYNQFGAQTLPSPEIAVQLTIAGEIHVLPPVGTGPPQATGMEIYIGTSPGAETYQGYTTSVTAQYTQAVALTAGAAPPVYNSTVCRVVANDAAWPTGTGYRVSLVDVSGNTLFSYPELWQFYGPGSTYNLSQGIPYYHGQVTYPVPLLTLPYNHNPQGIASPLGMNGYNISNVGELGVGTSLPAWGVDVEGTGLSGKINAAGGYLINGLAGTNGQVPCSDGTAIDEFCNFPAYSSLAHAIVTQDLSGLTYGASALLENFISPVAAAIPLNGTGTYNTVLCQSQFSLSAATTGSTIFTLKRNGSSFGTITFGAGSSTAPAIAVTAQTLAIGDTITIVAPSTPDATAAGLAGSLCIAY